MGADEHAGVRVQRLINSPRMQSRQLKHGSVMSNHRFSPADSSQFRAALRTLLCLVFATTWSTTVAYGAPPDVKHLYPSGAARGTTSLINVVGKLGSRPVFPWCSRADVTVDVSPDAEKIEITTKSDARPGLCWIRFYNAEGASSLRPFLISRRAEMLEVEPNNSLQQAQKVESTFGLVNGALSESQDVDTFAVDLKKGETLIADVTADNVLGSPMDGILQIVSAGGIVLAQNDDDREFDPRIVFNSPAEGRYFVRTFAFPKGPDASIRFSNSPEYVYRLTLTTGPFADYPWPLAVSSGNAAHVELRGWNLGDAFRDVPIASSERAQFAEIFDDRLANVASPRIVPHRVVVEPASEQASRVIELPASVCGTISRPNESDEYRFVGTKGETVTFEVQSRELGLPLDPLLTLVGPDGKNVAEVDDASSGVEDATLTHTIPADGEYRLRVEDRFGHAGERFVYLLNLTLPRPDFKLTVAGDIHIIAADKPLEIDVNVQRLNGFAEDVTISAVNLPKGVTCKPVVSHKDGDSSKAVKLVLEAAADAERPGTFRINGKGSHATENEREATAPLAPFKAETAEFWLNVPHPKLPRPPAVAKRPGK